MADIDMIPRSYRGQRQLQRQLRRYLLALGATVLLGLAATALLRWRVGTLDAELQGLRRETAQAQAASVLLDTARARAAMLEQSTVVLAALRGAGDLDRVASAFDAAMPPQVWLRQLQLARDVQPLTAPATPQTGDLQVSSVPGNPAPQSWRVATTLQLRGQATDYTALAGFLKALGDQAAFSQVSLTGSVATQGADTIDFDAKATLRRVAGSAP